MDSTVEVVTDAQMWSLVVGFLAPLVVAVTQRPTWPNWVRVLVAIAWSAVAGGGTAWFAGEFTGRGVVSCGLVVLVAAITSYANLWKPTGVAPWIEAKTTPGGAYVVTGVQRSPQVRPDGEPPVPPGV